MESGAKNAVEISFVVRRGASRYPATSVAHVRGPTMPSGTRSLSRWNCLTAASIVASKLPFAARPSFV